MALLPVIAGQLPAGFCATDYQSILNEFSARQTVNVSAAAGSGVIVSATKPLDGTLPWLRLDQFGRPERLYWFASGAWLSLHPSVPGLTQWWFDVVPDFTTFDGGDALALSALSGPMWQLAKNSDGVQIAAKFPIAAGTLPSSAVLAQGATGGEETHALTIPEIPPHTHNNGYWTFSDGHEPGPDHGFTPDGETDDAEATSKSTGGVDGVVTPHNNLPPYVVGYLLQRTTRLFYAIT